MTIICKITVLETSLMIKSAAQLVCKKIWREKKKLEKIYEDLKTDKT